MRGSGHGELGLEPGMLHALRIAWRNLSRNRRRTVITVTAVLLNTAVLIATDALMTGLTAQTIRNATEMVVGEAQIHAAGYRAERSMYQAIPDPAALLARAHAHGIGAAPRTFGFGLLSAGAKSAGASFWGVDPAAERAAFDLPRHVATGRFLADAPAAEVVIGRKLARSLEAGVGSELVAVVQAADGSLGNELYKVVGILQTVGDDIDRGAVFMHRAELDRLFAAGGRVHEIALDSRGAIAPGAIVHLYADLPPRGLEVVTWRQLLPAISDMQNLSGATTLLFGLVFLLAAGLGVLNTMLMATHDRVREYGLVKALGASRLRIFRDVLAEAALLSLVANALGVALGVAGSFFMQKVGIDLSALGGGDITFSGIAFDPIWRGMLRARAVVEAVVATTAACLLASLYPAIKAARLDPARAMTQV
jgi:ABC-type lipoprotein release transport system permease subunit